MFDELKKYGLQDIPFSCDELMLMDAFFELRTLKKNEFLFEANHVCDFVGFIAEGSIWNYYIHDGKEITCDFSFENTWVTDIQSFRNGSSGRMNLQGIEYTIVNFIRKRKLLQLYQESPKFELMGRQIIESIVQKVTETAVSERSDKPEERFVKLLKKRPN